MTSNEELFEIVDADGQVTGRAPRSECHGNPALVHRAVHVLVLNPSGELLLQKRSHNKDIQPGKWDTSVGGHLDCGETYLSAAKREMAEELGLTGISLTFLYPSQIRNDVESENIETFLAVTDRTIAPNLEEIDAIRFWAASDIEASLGTGVFTPNFEAEWDMLKNFAKKYQAGGANVPGFCAGNPMSDIFQQLYQCE